MMSFEERVLAIVASVTQAPADFFNGTLFVETQDSKVATAIYNALSVNNQSTGIVFGKANCTETFYDFV
jgi:hypothetical protein